MSLKAKLEAVIYAAEEPVTLAQLAALFADEALEWKTEQEKAAADAEPALASVSAAEPLLDEAFACLELEQKPEDAAPSAVEADEAESNAAEETAPEPVAEAGALAEPPATDESASAETQNEPQPAAEDPSATAEPATTAEEAAKQAARQRDREVRAIIRRQLDELIEAYATDGRGIEIREIAGGYRMATKPEYHDAVRSFVKSLKPALKLSLPALETLAVIAYKQPVTAPEVNEIRGVDSSGVFGSLLARKLIATAGRKSVLGRPILYKTTKEFLLRFGLKDLSELPSMEEFEKIAASELAETEIMGEEPSEPAAQAADQETSNEETSEPAAPEAAPEADAASATQEAEPGASQPGAAE